MGAKGKKNHDYGFKDPDAFDAIKKIMGRPLTEEEKKKYKRYVQKMYEGMFRRTTPEYQKKRPTYKGVYVCDEWKNSPKAFKQWVDSQMIKGLLIVVFTKGKKNPPIDKDLLVPGNRMYGPDVCVIVMEEINAFLTNKQRNSKSGIPGVVYSASNKLWRAFVGKGSAKKRKAKKDFTFVFHCAFDFRAERAERLIEAHSDMSDRIKQALRDSVPYQRKYYWEEVAIKRGYPDGAVPPS